MKSLHELAEVERGNRAGEFASLIRHFAAADGHPEQAATLARRHRAPPRTIELLEKAVVPGMLDGGLLGFAPLVSAFQDTLRWSSVFFRMLADNALVRVPFQVRVGSILAGATAAIVAPGAAFPVSRMDFGAAPVERQKAVALIVLTKELLTAAGSAAEALLSRSLRASVAQAVDTEVVAQLIAGVTPTSASDLPLADLRTVLSAVAPTNASRLYWLASPDVTTRLATLGESSVGSPLQPSGARMFPSVSPIGGTLLDLPLLPSSAVAAGSLILVDAAGWGAASDTIDISISTQASLEMSDSPLMHVGAGSPVAPVGPEGSLLVNLWQMDSVAIQALAYFAVTQVRQNSVAVLEIIAW